ncbi:telomere repeat-binding protein 4 [Daucus carota subsp. sativus]|uniref:telomere repeat-binding protein 4 n=1 Tax=Daucus carota subsp. sativus TaxID=79200 RepID=UPI0007F0377D|nr:PREDICTED: telomere repeat-binding protein 4-like [Daucus carota subsp. sativus]
MVLKKRQEYGFHGNQIPVVPTGPRSLRRRRSFKKESLDDDQLCAFELLAAVAGKLLRESESSASSNVAEGKVQLGMHKDGIKKEQVEETVARPECLDQESCIESVIVPKSAVLERSTKSTTKELPLVGNISVSEHISVVTNSNFLDKVGGDAKHKKCTSKAAARSFLSKSEESFLGIGKLCDVNIGDNAQRMQEGVGKQNGHFNMVNCGGLEDPQDYYVHSTHKPINFEGSIKFPLYRDNVPVASFHKHGNNVKIADKDDDENYFRSSYLNTRIKASRPQSRFGYRRMKKLMTSRNWRTAPKLIDYEFNSTGRGDRPIYHKRKTGNAYGGYQRELHSKRRRLHDRRKMCHYRSATAYDQQASSESISNFPEKAMKGDNSGTPALHRENVVSSSDIGHKASFHAKDTRVKFSIKSFKVPELYIEVPETATVGSLKMTVMKAVNAILEGGLHVGVVLQGQRVENDNITLRQIGISHDEDLDTLGFTLEPNLLQATSPISRKDPPVLLPCNKQQDLSRLPVPALDSGFLKSSYDPVPVTKLDNHVENNQEIVPYFTDVLTDVSVSKALVPVPPMNVNTLAIVPLNQKAKRTDLSQRRTRRPFSVSEVEALVEAVEKLGTGRWRDVKMRSFDDVNHRTYVDLKDKWKTLVHTASIAPQQRRGQPVPQELLDRVLAAHAYWSQHQSKQHGKHQIQPLKFAGEVGV